MTRTRPIRILALVLFAVALSVTAWALLPSGRADAQQASSTVPGGPLLEDERNTVDVVERYGPSVVAVNVTVEGRITNPFEDLPEDQIPPFFRQFMEQFRQQQAPRQGSGSGFVVDADGRIVTNYHVIQAALEERSVDLVDGAEITVSFPNDGTVPVRVVGANALYDLALLELENDGDLPDGLQPIPLGDGSPRVGQKVIAIGNPFGFESTVTTGIVSAVGRNLQGVGEVNVPLVQTDAAINPGNSGGPLLDSGGRLIGVNTAIIPNVSATGQRGSLGIGFAVPSTTLAQVLDELRGGGFVSVETRPRLGVTVQNVAAYPQSLRERLGLPDSGVAVLQVAEGGAAAEAGLRPSGLSVQIAGQTVPVPDDVITAIDGTPVETVDDLQREVFSREEGDTVELTVIRRGEEITVDVTLAVVPVAEDDAPEDDAEQ
jgi:S1-C subfamily serine protease